MMLFVTVCGFIYLVAVCYESDLRRNLELHNDGVCILRSPTRSEILTLLPKDYEFLDYRYSIKGCSLSSYHRDVTSSPYEFDTQHPVYTLIAYHSAGRLLGVVPGSHRTVPFTWGRPQTIGGESGTAVLFNSDVLHAGAMSSDANRHAEQFKIAHKDDVQRFDSLQGVDTEVSNKSRIGRPYEYACRKISLLFPWFFNHVMTRYLQQNDGSTFNRFLLFVFGRSFYNR